MSYKHTFCFFNVFRKCRLWTCQRKLNATFTDEKSCELPCNCTNIHLKIRLCGWSFGRISKFLLHFNGYSCLIYKWTHFMTTPRSAYSMQRNIKAPLLPWVEKIDNTMYMHFPTAQWKNRCKIIILPRVVTKAGKQGWNLCAWAIKNLYKHLLCPCHGSHRWESIIQQQTNF